MKIKGYLDKFFNSLAYYALICIVVVLCWQFDVYLVGAGIVFILGGISLFVCDDVIPFFTCLMPVMYMFKSLIIADYAPYLPFILVKIWYMTDKFTFKNIERTENLQRYFDEIKNYKILTPDEEYELVLKAQNGDMEARDLLIMSNQRFIYSYCKSSRRVCS